MTKKITLLFRQDQTGWSESYYLADPGNTPLKTVIDNLVSQRRALMGSWAFVIGARAFDVATPKNVSVYQYNSEGQATTTATGTTIPSSEQAHVYAGIPMKTETGTRRMVYLSCIPDQWVERIQSGNFIGLHTYAAGKVDSFAAYLVNSLRLQIRERDTAEGLAKVTINDIITHVDGRYEIQHAAGITVVGGDKVTFSKVKGNNLAGLKGARRVVDVDPDGTWFTVDAGPRQDLGNIVYLGGGKVQKVGYRYSTANVADEPKTISTRKRGRPFTPRRGRRSVSR